MPHFLSDYTLLVNSILLQWKFVLVDIKGFADDICKREEKARLVGLTKLLNDILQSKQDA